ncbi:MAG: DUF4157 domain-containing protein [Puniceicoccaceae bacterium]|nr:MAG: DUF4157 domain-containing protein [Puniceicoccaceae bacterium]
MKALLQTSPSRHRPTPSSGPLVLQRCSCGGKTSAGGECAECRKKRHHLQRAALSNHPPALAPPIVHNVVRSSGQPLPAALRGRMEARFGYDFSTVRIHSGERAAASARAVAARAYTVGDHVVFGHEGFAPQSPSGERLLAHELAHVVQQAKDSPGSDPGIEIVDRPDLEAAAESAARSGSQPTLQRHTGLGRTQLARSEAGSDGREGCTPGTGIRPGASHCLAYLSNSWWLPLAYVNNATCACLTTPDVPTANCVRQTLQDRMNSTPRWLKGMAAAQKPLETNPATLPAYHAFVQTFLTPRIYNDHVVAYRDCCCPSGPASYPAWIGVTTVPIQPCSLVGLTIRHFGSCHGTPGAW